MPGMHVTVRLSGSLAERLGNRLVVELAPGARVRDLLEALAADGELGDCACDWLAVVAGGSIVADDRVLADGDRLDVLVPAGRRASGGDSVVRADELLPVRAGPA